MEETFLGRGRQLIYFGKAFGGAISYLKSSQVPSLEWRSWGQRGVQVRCVTPQRAVFLREGSSWDYSLFLGEAPGGGGLGQKRQGPGCSIWCSPESDAGDNRLGGCRKLRRCSVSDLFLAPPKRETERTEDERWRRGPCGAAPGQWGDEGPDLAFPNGACLS